MSMRMLDDLCNRPKGALEGTVKFRGADLLAVASQLLWSGFDLIIIADMISG